MKENARVLKAMEAVKQSIDIRIEQPEISYVLLGALKKQLPEAPTRKNRDFECAVCRTRLNGFPAYCGCCGQRLDWTGAG